jgi:lipopolysaccharide transport system permease protein
MAAQPGTKAPEIAALACDPVVIEPARGWVGLDLPELWRHRELIGFLALRDIRIRYKQSLLGAAWAVLQPLLTMVVFTLLFGLLLGRRGMPTVEGVPYAVSTYCALVPWQLFATSLASSGDSLVTNQHLIRKVYFPRLVAPIAPLLAALLDFGIALAVLFGMMLYYGVEVGWSLLALPLFVLLAILTSLGVSLWLSAANALYRDVRFATPFLIQLWMFVTPVVYTTASVMTSQPEWVQLLYALNPMAGVTEGFRWALLGAPSPPAHVLGASLVAVSLLLVGGALYFRRMERTFADLV